MAEYINKTELMEQGWLLYRRKHEVNSECIEIKPLSYFPSADVVEREVGMTAVDYLRTARRMCRTYRKNRCDGCPFWITNNCLGLPGDMTEWQMVTTVKKWGEEHKE